MLTGIFILALLTVLHLAASLVLPIAIAMLMSLLLAPVVRVLGRWRVPESVGAGVAVFGSVLVLGTALSFLAAPASDWLGRAPRSLAQAETRLRRMVRPLRAIQETAERVDQVTHPVATDPARQVQLAQPGLLERLSVGTARFVAAGATVLFLSYFLLAAGGLFRRKLARALQGKERERVEQMLEEMQVQMSRYLLLTTLINSGVGLATWGLLALAGMPNAALWGMVAGVLNFVPYIGAVTTALLIGIAALVSFDSTGPVVAAVGGFVLIHLTESNLVTPAVLGRRLPLNAVAIFLGLLFWGWMWGTAGAVLAVPLTVVLKIGCEHVERLQPVAAFLDA